MAAVASSGAPVVMCGWLPPAGPIKEPLAVALFLVSTHLLLILTFPFLRQPNFLLDKKKIPKDGGQK